MDLPHAPIMFLEDAELLSKVLAQEGGCIIFLMSPFLLRAANFEDPAKFGHRTKSSSKHLDLYPNACSAKRIAPGLPYFSLFLFAFQELLIMCLCSDYVHGASSEETAVL